ncbi:MAG: hypothetical protein HGA96_00825 [Desulfobulbaceae bacterium]|nr:hypothetical protein [Desulfobulbaceae bacterium]
MGWFSRRSVGGGGEAAWRRAAATFLSGCLLLLAGSAGAGESAPLRLVLAAEVAVAGENLIANPAFAEGAAGLPTSWRWTPRNTAATLSVVPEGRWGRNAVRITNPTASAPHVYGQLVQSAPVRLEPGATYTLSAYVKGDDPGPAWIGGGEGWWLRLALTGTQGQWRRFSRTFIAHPGDVNFPLMINSDGPTPGFLVTDLKLEQGERATPFTDGATAGGGLELIGEIPPEISSPGPEVVLPFFLYSREARGGIKIVAALAGEDGVAPAAAELRGDLAPGLHELQLVWDIGRESRPSRRLSLALYRGGVRLAEVSGRLAISTESGYQAAQADNLTAVRRLDQALAAVEGKGQAAPYARAAQSLAARFGEVAAAKRQAGRLAEASQDLRFLAGLAGEQCDRLQAQLAGKRPPLAVPEPPLAEVEIRAGNFWVKNQPVMFIGGMGYGELREQLGSLKDFGFNCVGDDYDGYAALRMLTGADRYDDAALPRLRQSWEELRGYNLAFAFNPTLHYFPEWALSEYPDLTGGVPVDGLPDWSGLGRAAGKRTKTYGNFFPFAIDSPSLRRLVAAYYGRLFTTMRDYQGFHLVWVMNEPTYASQDPHYLQLYRDYLRRKFVTLAPLNQAWGSSYGDFAEISPPTERNSPSQFDWLTFHQEQVAGWFEWLAATARQADPGVLLSNKPMAWTLLHPELGIDWEREARLWDVPGSDAERQPQDRNYAFAWQTASMALDFQKSIAPGKPLADFEYHYVHEAGVSAKYVRATYWQSYLHGLRFSDFWVWNTGQLAPGVAAAGMSNTAWSQPEAAWGTASVALDLRRLAPYVAAFPQRPEVFLYYSRPSLYRDNSTYPATLAAAYEAANGLDAPVGFITDAMIQAGQLTEAKLLLVPAARFVQAEVLAKIRDFAGQGGRVVLLGDSLTVDEYGRPHGDRQLRPGANVRQLDRAGARELATVFEQIYQAAGINRPVRALGKDGKPAWPVECRTALVEGKRITYLIGLNKEPLPIRLVGRQPVRGWEELISQEKGTGGEFVLKPLEVRLLRLE